jgi:hypothetical protein
MQGARYIYLINTYRGHTTCYRVTKNWTKFHFRDFINRFVDNELYKWRIQYNSATVVSLSRRLIMLASGYKRTYFFLFVLHRILVRAVINLGTRRKFCLLGAQSVILLSSNELYVLFICIFTVYSWKENSFIPDFLKWPYADLAVSFQCVRIVELHTS